MGHKSTPRSKSTIGSYIVPPATPLANLTTKHPYAVCTLVMMNYHYIQGAAVLAHSTRNVHKVKVDLVCLVTNDIITQSDLPEDVRNAPNLHVIEKGPAPRLANSATLCGISGLKILLNVFDHVVLIDPISFPVPPSGREDHKPWISQCFSKLHVFHLTSYEKVLFLDADMQCTRDFSSRFRFSCPFGTLIETTPGYSSGELITKARLATSLHNRYGISAACFCVKPSDAEFDRAVERLNLRSRNKCRAYFETLQTIWPARPSKISWIRAGPDEHLLAWMYFPRGGGPSWKNLSRQYNCPSWEKHKFERGDYSGDADDCLLPQDRNTTGEKVEVYIVHYVSDKPWCKKGEAGKIWPDTEMWFTALESLRDHLASGVDSGAGLSRADIDTILEPLLPSDTFMIQEDADKLFDASAKFKKPKRILE